MRAGNTGIPLREVERHRETEGEERADRQKEWAEKKRGTDRQREEREDGEKEGEGETEGGREWRGPISSCPGCADPAPLGKLPSVVPSASPGDTASRSGPAADRRELYFW